MNLKYYKIIGLIIFILTHLGCSESDADKNNPTGSHTIPQQVKEVIVKNFEGGAIIKYELPDDLNMKYVKATYSLRDGKEYNVNASFHVDSLVVEGFPESKEYEVKLYSMSYGETASEPVTVKVHPQMPPYQSISRSLTPSIYFGGLRVVFEGNARNNPVSMGFLKKVDGRWTQVDAFYTSATSGDFYLFNQESIESDFGVFVTDRWGNISDTTYVSGEPWFEEECNKNLFKNMALPSDTYECHSWNEITKQNDISKLWDGVTTVDPVFQTKTNTTMPQWFTIDLGKEYNLSRFVMNTRYYPTSTNPYGNAFKNGHPKRFEIWGSNNPNPDGSYDGSWYLISDYTSVKPSGDTPGATSEEDKELVRNGEIFLIPPGSPSARYIRFKTNEPWTPATKYIYMAELTFFGANVENN